MIPEAGDMAQLSTTCCQRQDIIAARQPASAPAQLAPALNGASSASGAPYVREFIDVAGNMPLLL
jgi:hypothetical protein